MILNYVEVERQLEHFADIAGGWIPTESRRNPTECKRLLLSLAKEMRDLAGHLEREAAAIPSGVQGT